eukprot:10931835-Karenia_brevis.AAC.1
MTQLAKTSRMRRKMLSRMITLNQPARRSVNFSRYTVTSDIHNPENWPELCATPARGVTSFGELFRS